MYLLKQILGLWRTPYLLVFLAAIFLLDGLGIKYGRETGFFLILIAPFFLFSSLNEIKLPKKITILFILFFFLSLASAFFSLNIKNSFESLLLYSAYFLFFLFASNSQEQIKKFVTPFLFGFAFFFSIYSLFLKLFMEKGFLFLLPQTGYQLVYSTYSSHNHLGDFLVLPLIVSLYLLIKRVRIHVLLAVAFFLIFFIFSYSRSAYLSLFIPSLIMFTNFKKKAFSAGSLLIITACLASFVLLFTTVKEAKGIPFLNLGMKYFAERNLSDKSFLATRTSYFKQAFSSILNKPLFGVGQDNFVFASAKYAQNLAERVYTSHNIFLDIFSENGILAGVIFLGIICLFFINSEKSLLFLLAIAALINFQTDYTFKIYSFLALFWVLAGSSYAEKINFKLEAKFIKIPSFLLALIAIFILLSNAAIMANNSKLAFYLYPLNFDVYPSIIEKNIEQKNNKEAINELEQFGRLFSGDPLTLDYIGRTYVKLGQNQTALLYFEKAYISNPYYDFSLVEKIYELKIKKEGKTSAEIFIKSFFAKYQKIDGKWANEDFHLSAIKFCQKLYERSCPYEF